MLDCIISVLLISAFQASYNFNFSLSQYWTVSVLLVAQDSYNFTEQLTYYISAPLDNHEIVLMMRLTIENSLYIYSLHVLVIENKNNL